MIATSARIHPTALVEAGVTIGSGTAVWDAVHIRHGAVIGADCIVGEKTYIAYDVRIGRLCKLNACVYVCAGVELEDGVMVAAHTVFTNDRAPRAADTELEELRSSEPDEHTLRTVVRRGATIGANATVGPGLELGEFCMVGMGSVVTRDVLPHTLVAGNPSRIVGLVARDGTRVWTADEPGTLPRDGTRFRCPDDRILLIEDGAVEELGPSA